MTKLTIYSGIISLVIIFINIKIVYSQAREENLAKKCEALEDLKINYTHILSASIVRDDGDLPDYCRVTGYVKPAIHFEIRLPLEQWNSKFYMTGCGALCGNVNSGADHFFQGMNYGLKRNYAVSTMDGGHWGRNVWDARWAYNDRRAEIDWAYRAVHETARAGKRVIEEFYEEKPQKSYFNGCSTGGRMAVMEAIRYPKDFDGIISGAPALDEKSLILYSLRLIRANTGEDGEAIITSGDMNLIKEKVYNECDKLDGLKDGLISKPSECDPDWETLLCKGKENEECLTKEQISTLKVWYEGGEGTETDNFSISGLPYGSEPYWPRWIIGKTDDPSQNTIYALVEGFLRYVAFEEDAGPEYDIEDFDFKTDPKRMEYMADIYNAVDPDLSAFKDNGGKLIMYQGWADVPIPPQGTIDYYEDVKNHFGSWENTRDFFRLYMIPGMGHCGLPGGPGIFDRGVDFLTALEKWVENGEAPESLLSTKYDVQNSLSWIPPYDPQDSVLWTRPVCPYPKRAVYKGSGDIDEAANFECVGP